MNFPKIKIQLALVLLIALQLLMQSCDKQTFAKDGKLRYSRDTVVFDTSFTQIGSYTTRVIVKNTNNKDILIRKIYLEKGNSSRFRMNVDGFPGPMLTDVEVLAGDSIFVFIESTINPTGSSSALFEEDNIIIEYADKLDKIYLAAPGNHAKYFFPNDTLLDNLGRKYPVRILQGAHVWDDKEPIVIVGNLVVDAGATLTMTPGTHVHMFNGAILWVYKGGTLKVLGERNRKVIIEGTRLGAANANLGGQWDRIWLNEGSDQHVIRHAIIKNGRLGVQAGGLDITDGSSPRHLLIENTSIYNMTSSSMLAINYKITANNLFVNSFYQYGVALVLGGDYKFTHSTISGYQSGTRPSPGLYFTNSYSEYIADMNLRVENSIIYGTNPTEVAFDIVSGTQFDYLFENCLLKVDPKLNTETSSFVELKKNIDPKFYAPYGYDPSLKGGSEAIDAGNLNFAQGIPFDIHGKNRILDAKPDLGCAEYKGD